MMTHPASVFVIVFTAINIGACLWLMWWNTRINAASAAGAPTAGNKTGHVWDGDLEECNNPLPRWWLWLFIITVVFGAVYLILYPGLGNFSGASRWSSIGAYEKQIGEQRARFDARLASLQEIGRAHV